MATSTTSSTIVAAGLTTSGTLTATTASLTNATIANMTTSTNVGTANTGVTATEEGFGELHKVTLSFTNLALPDVADNAAKAVGKLLYTLPAGVQIIDTAYMSVSLTAAEDTTATPDVGLGSVMATGGVSVLSGTGTFEDILTGQTAADCNGTATVACVTTQLVRLAAAAKTVHLNVAATWADTAGTDLSLTATGTVIFWYRTMV